MPRLLEFTYRRAISIILILLIVMLALPILSLALTSFRPNDFGGSGTFISDNWHDILSDRKLLQALNNTLSLTVTRCMLGIALGVTISWLIARTNLPGKHLFELGFWIALFMPSLPVTLAWIMLFDTSGIANGLIIDAGLRDTPLFDIYSWWGIIWIHMTGSTLAASVFLLVPAFKNLDSSLEEAARVGGASTTAILRKIVVPIMIPSIIAVGLLLFIRALQAFEVELILGVPAQINVYSAVIYRMMTSEPQMPGIASALSMMMVIAIIPLVIAQQIFARRRSRPVLSGKFRNKPYDLGKARWPLAIAMLIIVTIMTIVPFIVLLLSTFMKIFGLFDLEQPFTFLNWSNTIGREDFLSAFRNTMLLGVWSSLFGMIIYSIISYVIVRSRLRLRFLLDFSTWMPALVPGVVLSLGLLQVFSGIPIFRPFYGTIGILVLAVLISGITVGTQLISGTIRQIGPELEEAAWTAGASKSYAMRRIVVPLSAPTIAVVGLDVFASAMVAVGIVSLLGTGSTQPLAMLQLTLMDSGSFEASSVVGVVIMIMTILAAVFAKVIASNYRKEV